MIKQSVIKQNNGRLGSKQTEETKRKIKLATSGKKNHKWKGSFVGYFGLHTWLQRTLGKPTKCDNPSCFYPRKNRAGKIIFYAKQFVWANKTGRYLRDSKDFWQLCNSCNHKDGIKVDTRFRKQDKDAYYTCID